MDDAIKRLEQKIDALTGILVPAAQAFIIAAEGLEKMQATIDEVHAACTKERPKSELKPALDRIEDAVTRTADAVEDGMSNLPVVIHAAVDSAFEAREMADG